MPAYNGNNAYLSINGHVVGAATGADANIYRSFEMDVTTGDEDVSAGAGITWEAHADKLSVINGKAMIVYDPTTVVTDIDSVLNSLGRGSVVEIIWGPEGNGSGKPKHQQDFLITQVKGPTVNHDKTAVVFEITCKSTEAPTSNFYAGDTFAA